MTQINQPDFLAQDAAARIIEELEIRGLTAETPINSEEFANKITNIILETMRGNTNYCVTTASEDGLGWPKVKTIPDELKDKLIREIGINDDYPPTHPLEN